MHGMHLHGWVTCVMEGVALHHASRTMPYMHHMMQCKRLIAVRSRIAHAPPPGKAGFQGRCVRSLAGTGQPIGMAFRVPAHGRGTCEESTGWTRLDPGYE